MIKIYLTLCLFSLGFLSSFGQLQPVKVKIIDDKVKLPFIDQNNKRSIQVPTKCDVDTVEYPYYKASSLLSVSITRGRSLGQLYACPKPLTLSGFTFYAFVIPTNPPSKVTMNIICNVYKAGADSLPRGLPIRSDTITIDTVFGGGVISKFIRRASFTPITLDSNYILTVGTDSSNLSAGIVANNYNGNAPTPPNGRKENLNCGSISGLWYNGKNLNVGGIPFDCDILLHPYVKYSLGADFSIKNNCYNLNDSIAFLNAASSNMSGSKMYNRYAWYNLQYYCHWWDVGDNMGFTFSVDHKVQYSSKQNYQIMLISSVYGYKGISFVCEDTTIKTLFFKPDIPTFSGLTNVCIGDTAKLTAVSSDTGVVYEWLKKPNSPSPFFVGQVYKKYPLSKDDTFYLRANNNGCISGIRTIILKVNAYPVSLVVKNDSVCAGSKANLKGTTNVGSVQWFTASTGGLPFFIGSVYQTKILTGDTLFYAQAVNNGCALNPRQAVRAFVGSNFAPTPPIVSNDTVVCLSSGTGVTLNASATAGLTVRWFDVSSGGSSIHTGNTFNFLPSKREIKTYYVDAYNGVCGSTRVPVNVTIEDFPSISNILNDTICKGDSAYTGFTIPFGNANWFDAATGGNHLFSGTNFVSAPGANVDYYIETGSNICLSPSRTKISVLVNTYPTIKSIWGDTICAKNKATLKSNLTGNGSLNWYDSDTSNLILGTGKSFQTPVINGSKKYFAEPFYAGCYGPRQSAQPTVKPVPFSGFSFSIMTWQRVTVSPINSVGSTIKWYFGDGVSSSIKDVTHRYQNIGTYEIKLVLTSTSNGCKDSTTIPVLIETSGMNAIAKLAGIRIYPNPVAGYLNIRSDLNGEEDRQIIIYSSDGVLIKNAYSNVIDGLISIPVPDLSAGLYFIHISGFTPLMFYKE